MSEATTTREPITAPFTFADMDGREWSIRISKGLARRIRDTWQIDLLKAFEPGGDQLEKLSADEETFLGVLCDLLAAQMKARNITREQIEDSFDEQVGADAINAILGGIVNFFHPSIRRHYLPILQRINPAVERMVMKQIPTIEMDQIDKAMDAALDNWTTQRQSDAATSGQPSASLKPSPELTQTT